MKSRLRVLQSMRIRWLARGLITEATIQEILPHRRAKPQAYGFYFTFVDEDYSVQILRSGFEREQTRPAKGKIKHRKL